MTIYPTKTPMKGGSSPGASAVSCSSPTFMSKPSRLQDANYSQIELRVVEALAQDPKLLAAFEAGEGPHHTASKVMGVPMDQVEFLCSDRIGTLVPERFAEALQESFLRLTSRRF